MGKCSVTGVRDLYGTAGRAPTRRGAVRPDAGRCAGNDANPVEMTGLRDYLTAQNLWPYKEDSHSP
jgi:hypothetical protein